MTIKEKPLMTIDTNGIEVRVVMQEHSPWPYSIQRRVNRKTWTQVNAFTNQCDAFTQAVYYVNNERY